MPVQPTVVPGGNDVPPEPDWSQTYADVLDVAEAPQEWGLVVREMQGAQTLCVANGHAIERLTHFRLIYRAAVAEFGAILKSPRTKVPALKPRAERFVFPDPELTGHYVRVQPSGAKTFVVVARLLPWLARCVFCPNPMPGRRICSLKGLSLATATSGD